MTTSEKALGAMFGLLLSAAALFLFLRFTAMSLESEAYGVYRWLAALLAIPGLYIFFYSCFAANKSSS